MKVQVLRPSATPDVDAARQCVLLRAVRLSEAVSTAEVVNPTVYPNANSHELTLQPGTFYRAFTGVAFPDLSLREIQVTASTKAFFSVGLSIERIEIGPSSELLVYFSLLKPTKMIRDAQLFEMRSLALGTASGADVTVAAVPLAETGGLPALGNETRVIPTSAIDRAAAAVHAQARPTVDAAAWLNTPDGRGRVVDEAKMPAPAAPVAPTITLAGL